MQLTVHGLLLLVHEIQHKCYFLLYNDCGMTVKYLKHWKYRSDPSCLLFGSSQATSVHFLNGCPTALNQGRYTWRHDSVLNSIASVIKSEISPPTPLCADLPGYRASDNPQSILSHRMFLYLLHVMTSSCVRAM